MSEATVGLGREVPDFEIDTYLAAEKGFGKFSLAQAKEAGNWTILFFYPADFTFV
jgi:alkyl hydroperoxide reductase subunit AhpC